MTKKLICLATKLATSNSALCGIFQYEHRYFVSNAYEILEINEHIDGLPMNGDEIGAKAMAKWIDASKTDNTHAVEISAEKISAGIGELVGRKLSLVVWSPADNDPAFNARYIRDAAKALNATLLYCNESRNRPAYMFMNDDVQSGVMIAILPIHKSVPWHGFRTER